MMGPLIEAIFAGNAIVIKGSEQTAWSAQYNIKVARAALTACGHDENLVQVSSSVISG
jgi:acyl-CoA reductase-like NAD-dependent aldehyde dehydrogenase